eukprot:6195487-Pleurochrysis_carterae.AAC.1
MHYTCCEQPRDACNVKIAASISTLAPIVLPCYGRHDVCRPSAESRVMGALNAFLVAMLIRYAYAMG